MGKSIAIVQTSQVSSVELQQLCAEIMPEVKVFQIIDDSLIDEVVTNGGPTKGVVRRMCTYYQAAQSIGANAILNQCSSVSEAADIAAQTVDIPVVKIDAAMAREAVRLGRRIAVVATVETTVGPSSRLVESMAREAGKEIEIDRRLVDGAMMVLIRDGDRDLHNRMVLSTIEQAAEENDVVVLAQGSMTVLLPLLGHIDKPVLTSPRLAVEDMKRLLHAAG
jgi:Asp/Glu/hydantoin racemase